MPTLSQRIAERIDQWIRLPVVGLDLSDRSVKILGFRKRHGRFAVDFFSETAIPEGFIVKGEIGKGDELAVLLRTWRAAHPRHVRGAFVAAALPEEKSFLRIIQMPKVKKDEVGRAIHWEIESNIPLPAEELLYDQEVIDPLDPSVDHSDVVITAFPKSTVQSYIQVLKKAGFHPMALELESQAIVRAVVPEVRDHTARIIVDMGNSRTSFIIVAGGAIMFTTTIDLGGVTLEENIRKALNVDEAKAVRLKEEIGLDKAVQGGEVFRALIPAISVLADELKRTFEYYEEHANHAHGASAGIAEVLLTGGDANLIGLDTYLASSLLVPVRLADPFASIKQRGALAVPPFPKRTSVAFTTAIGLALRT